MSDNFIIVGCGRVGSTVARRLDADGNRVTVIDRRASAFRRLGDTFGGSTLVGVGFDRDLLSAAGTSPSSAVMAVTSGDNSNILVARVARELFGARQVVARIYDPKRAAIYERLGIQTVATVSWASERIHRLVTQGAHGNDWIDPTATFTLVERRIGATLAGRRTGDLGVNIVLLARNGAATVPTPGTILQEGDSVHLLAEAGDVARFDRAGEEGEVHP